MKPLLIFDFDGVIGDSEVIANSVLAELATEWGVPTTLEQSYARYMGKRLGDVVAAVERDAGRPLPGRFASQLQRRTLDALGRHLDPVPGVAAFIRCFAAVPRCIASSSSAERLRLCLDRLGLAPQFGANVFSTAMVARGKPHPDIFLFAAERMRAPPAASVVIEDSPAGIAAARAAGMTAIGLLAGSHVRPGLRRALASAGAHQVVDSFAKARPVVADALAAVGGRG